jgi:hydroxylamine reductase
MFCFQCEQTAKGEGCTKIGVCGKQPDVAALQDLLIYTVKGLAQVALVGRKTSLDEPAINKFTAEAVFSTLTNVDFDADRFVAMIHEGARLRDDLKARITSQGGAVSGEAVNFMPAATREQLVAQGEKVGVMSDPQMNADIRSLRQLLTYGLKGVAAYTDHARILGQEDEAVYRFIHEGLAATLDDSLGVNELVGLALKCGEVNLRAMELLDAGNTGTYGHPVPTPVPLGHKKGKAILVSGHDLKDLEMILQQTEGKGIFIYTHGEMLPTHGYPGLKKYGHFYGHYGTAWQNQAKEFSKFPGAIVMTTNCIQTAAGSLQGQHLYHRTGGLARRAAHRRQRFQPGHREGSGHARVHRGRSWKVGHGGLRPQCRARGRRTGDRGGQKQGYPPLLPGGRLRRRQTGP